MSQPVRLALAASVALVVAGCAGTAGPSAPAVSAPSVTPLAAAPAEPGSSGVSASIETERGTITVELYDRTTPVAVANFVGLARAGWYDGVVFHRLVPGFVIQGGDGVYGRSGAINTERLGTGGPGYTIRDEPIVGDYMRGTVAMARSPLPDSQGSQFFIVLDDRAGPSLAQSGAYAILGRVTEGIEVVDAIAALPNAGPPSNRALEPVAMTRVVIRDPSAPSESPSP